MKVSSVYGPVNSWRLGRSLGIDLLCVNSICSFRCIYCQLGKININTAERRLYVPTDSVMTDLEASPWRDADAITFSGTGEPTLATNLGEVIELVKASTGKPAVVLTNAAHLNDQEVRNDLRAADKVFCKLDAADERHFQLINRPISGLTLQGTVDGIKAFRQEYPGFLAIQIMLQRVTARQIEGFARILNEIGPDEVQLNSPSRPIPLKWWTEARGGDVGDSVPATRPRMLGGDEMERIETRLRQLTGLRICSVYSAN